MAQSVDAILQQLDTVITACESVRSRSKYDDLSDLKGVGTSEAIARMQAAIDRLAPIGSSHRTAAEMVMKQYGVSNGYAVGLLLSMSMNLDGEMPWVDHAR